ncbi:hypothetical protein MNEG_12895 [Monoraphidium neglectum]|uniref:Uncharacterized protein n=1 Tax=Monoraphidium neglectum TaxID=145388 RepID=A0A0D2KGZ9_9CHLO|nr:hypothetical protein MNEG_12895 [Monoraphidium neglectum]KIY95068.1 hypothetical protein MNEG_12895 [Monoraphidium neglectum]|eukprot:XP_013894088.1 hypothetical protein MNEG_12895 [Monoraphidium neglectum]
MMLSHSAARRAAAAPSKARPAPARPALRPRRPLAAVRAAGDVTGGAAGGGEDDRERLAHEVLRAESFEALPNDLKAAVAETAGGEQHSSAESLCMEGFAKQLSESDLEEYKKQGSGLPFDFQDDPAALPDDESAPIGADARGDAGGGAADVKSA